MTPNRISVLATVMFLLAAARSHAQPATAGTPVAETHLAAETHASVLADGTGSAFVGFKIASRGPSLPAEIAVARVLPSAGRYPEWSALPITPPGALPQANPPVPARILRAPDGGVLAFADLSSASTPNDVVRELGPLGADPGYPGFTPSYSYTTFDVVSRSDGGALILSKAIGSINMLATVVSPTGAGTEVLTPLQIGTFAAIGGESMAAVPSGVDGAIGIFNLPQLNGLSGVDMIAVRVDGTGHSVWPQNHRLISAATRDQMDQVAVSDGADGAVFAWLDGRNASTGYDIYAQRLLSTGVVATGWTAGGKAIAVRIGAQFAPAIASDDNGGAWIAWVDERNLETAGADIYFTHVLATGALATGFIAHGRVLCGVVGDQTAVQLARDGSGGVFAVWVDARDGEADLYAQHLDSAGNPTTNWPAGGAAVCTDGNAQQRPAIDLVSTGRAITAWDDARTGTSIVYAAALDATAGVVGVPRVKVSGLVLASATNPARGGLELRLSAAEPGEIQVTLFDVAGRVRGARAVSGPVREHRLHFGGLEPGVYLARASHAGTSALTRIAVLR